MVDGRFFFSFLLSDYIHLPSKTRTLTLKEWPQLVQGVILLYFVLLFFYYCCVISTFTGVFQGRECLLDDSYLGPYFQHLFWLLLVSIFSASAVIRYREMSQNFLVFKLN